MEDSSFAGWTEPPMAPGAMPYPDGRKLPSPPGKGYLGSMFFGVEATDGAITFASRYWPQRKLSEFQIEGKLWHDYRNELVYRRVHGNPILGLGGPNEARDLADCFVSVEGQLVFLRRADIAEGRSVEFGSIEMTS